MRVHWRETVIGSTEYLARGFGESEMAQAEQYGDGLEPTESQANIGPVRSGNGPESACER